jgi:uncharacterized membrane protein YjgN (DUF898 family)
LITLLTFGIGLPWAICIEQKWVIEHTEIDGKNLGFNGKGVDLFGKMLLWILLAVVTFGIYCLWIPIKMKQWMVSHTYIWNYSHTRIV